MNKMKSVLFTFAIIGLVGCGSTLHEKIMKGGTITLSDFKDAYQVSHDNGRMEKLEITDKMALAKLGVFAKSLVAEEKKFANNKTINQCNQVIAKAQNEMGEMNSYYSKHKSTIDAVRKQQADNTLMTGFASLFCLANEDCQEELADNPQALGEIHSMMNDKILEDNNAKGVMSQYAKLEKKMNGAKQRIAECEAKIQQVKAPYLLISQKLYDTCFKENWYDLSKEKNRHNACVNLVAQKRYEAYAK